MKKVTSIVIGAGLRGGHVYSQYALDHPDEFQVVAVAEPDKERRESFAKRHNIPEELCFESYEELLGKEKLADCAMICTMDRMHYEPTIMALKKGYHVLCEKPMSPDKKEIIEMGEMAQPSSVKSLYPDLIVKHFLANSLRLSFRKAVVPGQHLKPAILHQYISNIKN